MEKGFLVLELVSFSWLGIIILVGLALRFVFVKIDCEYHQIYALKILGVEVCGE